MGEGQPIREIVIVGGGTAGWMTAAAAARFLASPERRIRLIESEAIGTVGVGEGTIPPMLEFNQMLGIPEPEFLRATKGTYKLGIDFVGWGTEDERYFHPFGYIGSSLDGVAFHQLWLKHRANPAIGPLGAYSMSTLAAHDNRFAPPAPPDPRSPVSPLAYAFHLDASLYAGMLREFAEARGVERIEGRIVEVNRDDDDDHITDVTLESGQRIEGELFIDCSGFRSLLIGDVMGSPFEDWSHWLPCDRAIAMPSEVAKPLTPFTRAIANPAGWQWRIPLQHRTGNGHVYCSGYMDDEEAERILLANLDTPSIGTPKKLKFKAGRREKSWVGNVVAIGLSAGFLEPLESTSIWLIQHGIQKLFALFPDARFGNVERDEYNRTIALAYEGVRDFIILHYQATRRPEPFWTDVRAVPMPDTLRRKIDLFADKGRVFKYQDELFEVPSWVAVMLGQGIVPEGHDPMADSLPDDRVVPAMLQLRNAYRDAALALPLQEAFLSRLLSAGSPR
ncbi:MAG: tryptophan halogenase family protein [Pseudomonadota bacterium]